MEEIKIGEYVRINKDFRKFCLGIGEVVNVVKNEVYVRLNNVLPISFNINSIAKHSKNIIDLIEIGDYVNGYKVTVKESTLLCTSISGIDRSGVQIPISQYGENILSIVTKEQFESVKFEV